MPGAFAQEILPKPESVRDAGVVRGGSGRPTYDGQMEGDDMGIGISLLLIAAGAILVWAVDATVSGVDLVTVGWILLIVGAVGAFLSLIFWSSWGGPARRGDVIER